MKRRWLISKTNPPFIDYLSKAASVSRIFAQVLVNRGLKSPGDIQTFLNPGLTNLSDPFELPSVEAATERIKAALKHNERVLVHGDYDTDGLTATAIMVQALRAMGADVHYFIPNRMIHGYGFNASSVAVAKDLGARLIITVDCGISSFETAACATEEGIDVIITDHHEPIKQMENRREIGVRAIESRDFILPDAVAVVNPKINTQDPRLWTLSGSGVAFKLAQAFALDDDLPIGEDDCLPFLDLAALGTLADVVPLTGDNRVIVKEGLKYIRGAGRPGIRSLMQISGLCERELRAGLLSFTMVPRINAAGRMGEAGDVVRLFLSGSDTETLSIAERLDRTNAQRQRIEEEVYQDALAQLNSEGFGEVIVLHKRGWHLGVLGIVASRIAEEFFRPAFIFTIENDIAKGSARSIPGIDIYAAISACSNILIAFGGHRQAAGVKLETSNIKAFESRINALVKEFMEEREFVPSLEIDSEVLLSEINTSLVRELSLLEPIGHANPEPLLGARRLDIVNPKIVGNNHLKARLRQRSSSLEAIGFDMGRIFENLSTTSVDAVFTPSINEWNGGRCLQLNIKAVRPSL